MRYLNGTKLKITAKTVTAFKKYDWKKKKKVEIYISKKRRKKKGEMPAERVMQKLGYEE